MPPSYGDLELHSANGRFVAEIRRAAGQEQVAAVSARWMLTVSELAQGEAPRTTWSCLYPYDGEPRHYALSDDGAYFVQVSELLVESRPALRVHRFGVESLALPAAELHIDASGSERTPQGRTWLAACDAPVHLRWTDATHEPSLRLVLDVRDGSTRSIDLELGRVIEEESGEPAPLLVEPAVPQASAAELEIPFVTAIQVPAFAREGSPVHVRVEGSHPTPGWKLVGFECAPGAAAGSVELTPRSQHPDGPALQVLKPLAAEALIHGLALGKHVIAVVSRDGARPSGEVLVLPEGLVLRLHTSGGFIGEDELIELYDTGVLARTSKRAPERALLHVAPDALTAIDSALPGVESAPAPAPTKGAADLFSYELGWWEGDEWKSARYDDLSMRDAPAAQLIATLRALR